VLRDAAKFRAFKSYLYSINTIPQNLLEEMCSLKEDIM